MIAGMRFLLVILVFLAAPAAAADPIPGPFMAVDGDTLASKTGTRVRIAAVDAPEMQTSDGWKARAALDDLLAAGPMTCADLGQRTHGRVVATCRAADWR